MTKRKRGGLHWTHQRSFLVEQQPLDIKFPTSNKELEAVRKEFLLKQEYWWHHAWVFLSKLWMVYWDLLIVLVPRIASNGNNQQAHYSSGWLHHKMAWLTWLSSWIHSTQTCRICPRFCRVAQLCHWWGQMGRENKQAVNEDGWRFWWWFGFRQWFGHDETNHAEDSDDKTSIKEAATSHNTNSSYCGWWRDQFLG